MKKNMKNDQLFKRGIEADPYGVREDAIEALLERPIAYNPAFSKITGRITSGILLSQLIHWSRAVKWRKFYKTNDELMEETGLTLDEMKTAKKDIEKLAHEEIKLFEISHEGMPRKTFYTPNRLILYYLLASAVGGNSTNKLEEKAPASRREFHQHTITENTTETTQRSDELRSPSPLLENENSEEEKITLTPPPQPTYKKTPRAFANQRRAEQGKPPLQPKQSQKQLDTLGALKLADYFKQKAHEFHGLTFLVHNEDRKQIESTNGQLRKQMLAFFRRCDYDEKKAHEIIDWYLDLEGEWCGYIPQNCFKVDIVAKFENKDITKKGGVIYG